MKDSDLQPPKPLWHEDTRGRPRDNGYGRGNGGQAGPLSSAAHRMLNHTMHVSASHIHHELFSPLKLLACLHCMPRPYTGVDSSSWIKPCSSGNVQLVSLLQMKSEANHISIISGAVPLEEVLWLC